jgi:hypothetical protein
MGIAYREPAFPRSPDNLTSADITELAHLTLFDLAKSLIRRQSYWGLDCILRFRSRTDGTEAAVIRGIEGRWSSPSGRSEFP